VGERDRPPTGATLAEAIFFASPEALRDWLNANHATATELFVGAWSAGSGKPTVTWKQIVDEALCVGWIDGVRRGVPGGWVIRLTPRRKGSNWSRVNVENVARLAAEGRMRPEGIAAFERRTEARTAVYSYEQRHDARLTDEEERAFRSNAAAWAWFESRPKAYRTGAVWWVANVKRPETRARRLASLIEESAAGRMPKALTPPGREPDGSPRR
jgi:uncharacterized protein YdeI (YjbR/CyaY-like superfamily)